MKYIDETDKSFGLTGMAVSLMVWNAEERLMAINLDAEPEEAMLMTPDFYTDCAPAVGAKAVWQHSLQKFQLLTAMLVANVTCRYLVNRRRRLSSEADAAMRRFVADEGTRLCQLDDDESMRVYGQALTHCQRIFTHPSVAQIVTEFAEILRQRRHLSAPETFELLAPLSRL